MNAIWEKLSKKQQLAISVGGGIVFVLLLLQFILFPFLEEKKSVNQAIRNNEKILADMLLLNREFRSVKQRADQVQQVLARRPRDFTLFSHLERMAGAAGMKSNIKSINASKGALTGPYEELPAEIRLEKITLKQLNDFLYFLESPQELIRIKHMAIARMKESPEYLSTQIQVVTLQLAKGTGG